MDFSLDQESVIDVDISLNLDPDVDNEENPFNPDGARSGDLNDQSNLSGDIELTSQSFHPGITYKFKSTFMRGQNRSCQSSWFNKPPADGFPWLHYRPEDDSVLCYICSNEFKRGNLRTVKKIESSFISPGFQDLKKAIETFKTHQSSPYNSRRAYNSSQQRYCGINQ